MIANLVSKSCLGAFSMAAIAVCSSAAAAGPAAKAFASKSAPEGKTLFHQVAPEASGLKHIPKIQESNPLSYMYHSGFVTGGLAVGDLDGDGQLDLFFGGAAEPNRIYRGMGGLRFEEITEKTTGGIAGGQRWTTGVAMVDVDGDKDLDLYFCNYESPNQLFLNDGKDASGKLAFREVASAAGVAVVDSSHSAYFCDYDRDGDLDMFLLTNKVEDPAGRPGDKMLVENDAGRYRVKKEYERYYEYYDDGETRGAQEMGRPDLLFRNDGKTAEGVPKFTDVTAAAGIVGRGDGLSATWWDYNQDGWPDLYIGNDFLSEDKLWKNNGNGTFSNVLAQSAPHTPWFSMGADAGDLNNDLLPDFLIADMAATTHYKSKTTMGAMGGSNLKRAVGSKPAQYMRNTCLIGTGTGRFLEGAYLLGIASTDWTWAVKFADLDLDGWQDIYFTNGMVRAMNHSDHVVKDEAMVGKHPWDFYKERDPRPEKHRAYKNEQHFHFADVSDDWGLGRTAITYACSYADFDGDGDLDLLEVNLDEPPSLYRNDVQNGQAVVFQLQGQGGNTAAYGTRVVVKTSAGSQMRELFPQSGYHSLNEAMLHFGLGAETVISSTTVTWPDGQTETFPNLKAGQRYTLIQPPLTKTPAAIAPAKPTAFTVAADFPPIRHQEKHYDDYSDQLLLPHSLSKLGPALAWADVNGDGLADLYAGGGADQPGELRLADGKGGLKTQWVDAFIEDKAHEDMGAVFFDADKDGDVDLFVASGSYQFKRGDKALADRLYLNDGKGNFSKAPPGALPEAFESSGPVCATDFDRDGDVDIYVGSRVVPAAYPTAPVSRLLRNDSSKAGAKFTDVTEAVGGDALRASGMVSGAVWSDVDGDGWQDLLLAHEWGTVRLFLNQKGKLTERQGATDDLAKNSGWWLSVDTADLDGDGDMDIVAGNFGYNTKYKEATPKKPKMIYYADFDNAGRKNIVEVKWEGDVMYPERGRSCSSTDMPGLKKLFPTYEKFAKATLSEVYGDNLKKADKFEANTLGTGVFWNEGKDKDGNVQFRYEALERIAQVAPSFGIAVADFNLDGFPDLFLAQNFHSAQIETGHYDGGLSQLILNRGKGHLEHMAAGESGISIPGDAKAATICDLDGNGQPDVLVSQNSGAHVPLLNGFTGSALQVKLPAHKAAGAKVTVQRDGAAVQVAEYHAGGGYLSQNPSSLTFGLGSGPTSGKIRVVWTDGTTTEAAFTSAGTVSIK